MKSKTNLMRTILFLTTLIFPSIVAGQESRPVNCRFLSFGGGEEVISALTLNDKGSEIVCPLPSDQLSQKVVCFAKNNTIGFLAAADKTPMAAAAIPPGLSSVLLVFVQSRRSAEVSSAAPWRVLVIEDSPKNFPDGGAFVANFNSKDIRFIIGEHKGLLHAAGANGYARPAERDAFNMSTVVFEVLENDKWRIANESALRFLPGMRYLIFAYTDPLSGRPRINTYQDFAPPAPSQAAP